MSKLVSDQEATGKVKVIYDEIRNIFGMVPNLFRAQAALDPDWLEVNWNRWKLIMGKERSLDRKTKEIIALTVSLVKGCDYCSLAHEAMARMCGASEQEIIETKEVIELFSSFNSIADSFKVPCDVMPEKLRKSLS
tara:strand:- start:213 stop:620 length:408 start_codon:yes stop_codon:yes gene_type:complete